MEENLCEGVSYEILENGTIIWEFSHNFYMPAQYSDFEFIIHKPEAWNFISVPASRAQYNHTNLFTSPIPFLEAWFHC